MWKTIAFYSLKDHYQRDSFSHAQLPTTLVFSNSIRVFFASRDREQHSSVYFVDLSFQGDKVTFSECSETPVLTPGEIGTFDEHGVFPSSIVKHRQQYFMYYIGWTQGIEPPLFYASIGLAMSNNGKDFLKSPNSPILSRSQYDPCLVTSPHVYIDDGLWRMTYVSGVRWSRNSDGKLQSHYHIKYAESNDGIVWNREGKVAIDFNDGETNIARSSVIKCNDGTYKMWFSFVNAAIGKYRIGYAISSDGYNWCRNDNESGIDIDGVYAKEMICYPCVFEFSGRMFMVHNGDNFGKYGFVVAVWCN